MAEMAETFGARLARLREAQGLTQGGLAQRVGIRQSMLSMLEAGQRSGDRIQAQTLDRLAQVLGVSMEGLLHGERPRASRRARQASP